jgi:hypothetical protein
MIEKLQIADYNPAAVRHASESIIIAPIGIEVFQTPQNLVLRFGEWEKEAIEIITKKDDEK